MRYCVNALHLMWKLMILMFSTLHRVKDGKDVYFFVNPHLGKNGLLLSSLEGEGSVEYWKQETGGDPACLCI